MRTIGLVLLLALAGCERSATDPKVSRLPSARPTLGTASAGTWQSVAPMPTVLSVWGLAAIGSRVYVVGTYWSGGTLTTAVEAYDPTAGAWTTLAPAPAAAGEVSVGTVAGRLYLVGGCAINSDCRLYTTGMLQVYDPATNTWSSGASMPTPRSGTAVGAINGKLYVAGGVGACPPCLTLAVVEVYDPGTNSWATAASLPIDVEFSGAGVINGKFYVAGGFHLPTPWPNTSGWTTEASLNVYDPAANAWTAAGPMPQAVAGFGAAALNGILYAAAGETVSGVVYDQFESYNPTSDGWTQLPALPQNVSGASMAALNGTLFLAGNGANGQPMASLLAYSLTADQTITFKALADKTFGDPDFTVSATATSGLTVTFAAAGNCTVSGSTVHITGAGSCAITASQAGDASSNPAPNVTQGFSIAKARPIIVWNPPASIVYGQALSGTQLNATATGVGGVSLTGTFTYSPPAGTILGPGPQTLGVTFTPDDAADYTVAAKRVSIAVLYNTAVGHVFLPPITFPPQPQRAFKVGSTIPVKFQLFLADGVTPVSTAAATIQVTRVSSGSPVTVISTVPNQGIAFRYDPVGQQYIFNLGTDNWSGGSYQLTASLDDGSRIAVVVGTR